MQRLKGNLLSESFEVNDSDAKNDDYDDDDTCGSLLLQTGCNPWYQSLFYFINVLPI